MPGFRISGVRSVVLLGAHPDDIEIGAGGLLLALNAAAPRVHYVLLTGSPLRQAEARAAAAAFLPRARLTFELHDLPDGRLPARWAAAKEIVDAAAVTLDDAELVLAPSPDDAHQDHRTLAELVPTSFRRAAVLYYEIPKWDGDLGRRNVYLPLTDEQLRRKVELLHACYPSQKARDWWDDEVFRGLARLRGMECRTRYAEAFRCDKSGSRTMTRVRRGETLTDRMLSICLFGVPGAELNLGVGALRAATVAGVLAREPDADVTVFDDGWGQRPGHAFVAGRPVPISLAGARHSRRYHRPESYFNMRMSAALGGRYNAGLAKIDSADVVLDVSGGDSFSDIYGASRFRTVSWPKRLTLLRRRPLVLLPQTYGPYRLPRIRAEAATLTRGATMAWARDPDSYAALADLLGADFDPTRHREGVDVAFALEARQPDEPAYARLARWFDAERGPVIGINISGLMARPQGGAQFGLAADVARVTRRLCERLLDEPDTRLIIVPHVRSRDETDDDQAVSERLYATLAVRHGDRVALVPPGLDPHQTKWVIARTAWFCGMRMHATIAALSSAVPAAILAYSLKARGVFASVGQERWVADARRLTDDELLAALWQSWADRGASAAELAQRTPIAVGRAAEQMDELIALAHAEYARRQSVGVRR